MLFRTARVHIVSLAIALAACGGGGSDTSVTSPPPVIPPPAVPPPVATSIAPNSGASLTAVVGANIAELPSVIVKDQRNAPMAGVSVTFTVASGGGTITGSAVETNASGVATIGCWILGTVAGSNSVTASTSGLPPITFIAAGTALGPDPGGSAITGVWLPTFCGGFNEAHAINDNGVVVGLSADHTDTFFAVRWTRASSGPWTITPIAGRDSRAVAINLNGAAVGVRTGRAKLWPAAGGEVDLGPHLPSGINSDETVVGWRIPNLIENPAQRAVVWRKPSAGWSLSGENPPQDLPLFPGYQGETGAGAINDAGVITGAVRTSLGGYYAVRWDPIGDQWTQPAGLPGTESKFVTAGRAINDNQQPDFAGHIRECSSCSVFGIFWPDGNSGTSLEPLGAFGVANGINNAKRVVGSRQGSAFLWWPGQTSLRDLGSPDDPYAETSAYDINNRILAQAVGYGYSSDTRNVRPIVWTIP